MTNSPRSSGCASTFRSNSSRDLLRRASDAVRARLAAIASPELREEIKRLLTSILGEAVEASPSRDFSLVEKFIRLKKQLNELDDAAVFLFAEAGKFDEVIVSLAVLNDAPIEMMARLLEGPRADLILIPCRSARLNWPSVETILRNRPMLGADQRGIAGAGAARFSETVDGNRQAHGALLAVAQQDREVAQRGRVRPWRGFAARPTIAPKLLRRCAGTLRFDSRYDFLSLRRSEATKQSSLLSTRLRSLRSQ